MGFFYADSEIYQAGSCVALLVAMFKFRWLNVIKCLDCWWNNGVIYCNIGLENDFGLRLE